jgi:hypothetical protein
MDLLTAAAAMTRLPPLCSRPVIGVRCGQAGLKIGQIVQYSKGERNIVQRFILPLSLLLLLTDFLSSDPPPQNCRDALSARPLPHRLSERIGSKETQQTASLSYLLAS